MIIYPARSYKSKPTRFFYHDGPASMLLSFFPGNFLSSFEVEWIWAGRVGNATAKHAVQPSRFQLEVCGLCRSWRRWNNFCCGVCQELYLWKDVLRSKLSSASVVIAHCVNQLSSSFFSILFVTWPRTGGTTAVRQAPNPGKKLIIRSLSLPCKSWWQAVTSCSGLPLPERFVCFRYQGWSLGNNNVSPLIFRGFRGFLFWETFCATWGCPVQWQTHCRQQRCKIFRAWLRSGMQPIPLLSQPQLPLLLLSPLGLLTM